MVPFLFCSYKVELKLRFSSNFGVPKFGVSGLWSNPDRPPSPRVGGEGSGEGGSLIYVCAAMKGVAFKQFTLV